MAAGALKFHVKGMLEDGEPLPVSLGLDDVRRDPDNSDGTAVLIELPAKPAKSVRVNVMLPEDLLKEIDRATPNRSRFLAEAAKAKLHAAA
jgi:hypothetical protein